MRKYGIAKFMKTPFGQSGQSGQQGKISSTLQKGSFLYFHGQNKLEYLYLH